MCDASTIGETNLEHMESLELNILALISQQIHHHLEIGFVSDVPSHHVEVGPI